MMIVRLGLGKIGECKERVLIRLLISEIPLPRQTKRNDCRYQFLDAIPVSVGSQNARCYVEPLQLIVVSLGCE